MMIFQHTYKNVLAGWVEAHPNAPETLELLQILPQLKDIRPKTQTRRLNAPHKNQVAIHAIGGDILRVENQTTKRAAYDIEGKLLPMQPGRGKKSIAWIDITAIRSEDVRNISHEDAIAEGFSTKYGFLDTWLRMHDRKMALEFAYVATYDSLLPHHCPIFLWDRPNERYQSWALTFRVAVINLANIRALVEAEAA